MKVVPRIAPHKAALHTLVSLIVSGILMLTLYATRAKAGQNPGHTFPGERIRVATTTSLYDTGLWDVLEPLFEARYNVGLDVLYSGTGIALELGRRGDVDAIVVHSKDLEEQFISEGYGVERVPFAFNYFVIVGPADDPAVIRGKTPEAAFRKLAEAARVPFISRGDGSGTHNKEKEIWKRAGYDYVGKIRSAGPWYIEAGRGMGPTLLMASEKQAYTLCDIGTYSAYRGKIELMPIIDEGPGLLNVYSVIGCNPLKNPDVNREAANDLVLFLTSPEIQELIGNFGIKQYGRPLFTPCSGAEPR